MLVLIYLIPLIDVLPISAGNSAINGPAGLATDKVRPEFSPKPDKARVKRGKCSLTDKPPAKEKRQKDKKTKKPGNELPEK
jgi:hypothetical protein